MWSHILQEAKLSSVTTIEKMDHEVDSRYKITWARTSSFDKWNSDSAPSPLTVSKMSMSRIEVPERRRTQESDNGLFFLAANHTQI